MELYIVLSLIFDIGFDDLFIGILANCIKIIPTCPEMTSPEFFLYCRVCLKDLFCNDTFYCLHHFAREYVWHTLEQKMHMIFVCSYFNKMYFITLCYCQTHCFDCLGYFFGNNRIAIFYRAYEMIEQYCFIVSFVDMLCHTHVSYHNLPAGGMRETTAVSRTLPSRKPRSRAARN